MILKANVSGTENREVGFGHFVHTKSVSIEKTFLIRAENEEQARKGFIDFINTGSVIKNPGIEFEDGDFQEAVELAVESGELEDPFADMDSSRANAVEISRKEEKVLDEYALETGIER